MKGPAIFLAQFMSDQAPFNSLPSIARWAAGHGYTGVQLPTIDPVRQQTEPVRSHTEDATPVENFIKVFGRATQFVWEDQKLDDLFDQLSKVDMLASKLFFIVSRRGCHESPDN